MHLFQQGTFEDLDLHLENVGDCTGLGGNQVAILGFGTLIFTIQDDSSRWHTHRVPNSLYIPKAKKVLICPQHWAQEAKDNSPLLHDTCEMTTHSGTILFWDQHCYRRTLSLHPSTRILRCFILKRAIESWRHLLLLTRRWMLVLRQWESKLFSSLLIVFWPTILFKWCVGWRWTDQYCYSLSELVGWPTTVLVRAHAYVWVMFRVG